MPNNTQATTQLQSSHKLAKYCAKFSEEGFSVNQEPPDGQAGFRKGRGTRNQIANICWIIEKAGKFQKSIYFCLTVYTKGFDCVDHSKLWKFFKR